MLSRRHVVIVLVAWVCLLVPTRPRAAAELWVEVKSPHFTVVSNASEGRARNVAWQFEQIRVAIESGWPWSRAGLDRPLVIVAARNEDTMRTLAPAYWEGGRKGVASVSNSSPDRHYIALRADLEQDDADGANPYRFSYWSYSNLMLTSSLQGRLPLWFTNGFSEVSSNTNITEKTVQFGKPLKSYVEQLQDRLPFPLATLLAITRDSPQYQREDRHAYDVECWGLMQFILFGEQASQARETRANQLARLLQNGTSSAAAVEQVFGSVQALEDGLKLFVKRGLFHYAQMNADAAIAPKTFTARPLTAAEGAAARAGLHVALNRPAEARAEMTLARQSPDALAAVLEAEALLLDRERKTDEARQAYTQAADLGVDSAYVYVRASELTPRTDQPSRDKTLGWLTRALTLNPRDVGAQTLMASVLLESNRADEALASVDRALGLAPRRVYTRLTRASILWRLMRPDEAIAEARTAVAMAATDEERTQAQTYLTQLESRAAAR